MIGRIYKVQHLDSSLCYVGSTCNTVRDRWRLHKNAFSIWLKNKEDQKTVSLFPLLEQYGIDRFQMLLIKENQIVDKKHLFVYEQLAINRTKSCCNENAALQLISLNCMAKHYARKYRQMNKQAIINNNRKYRQMNKQAISKKDQEYRQANKQVINEKNREYYQANKQSICAKAIIKITCECGSIIRKNQLSRHQKSAKHAKLLATLTQ